MCEYHIAFCTDNSERWIDNNSRAQPGSLQQYLLVICWLKALVKKCLVMRRSERVGMLRVRWEKGVTKPLSKGSSVRLTERLLFQG